jgi:regulator of sirC expression with transglutaminase-like and TPR domain
MTEPAFTTDFLTTLDAFRRTVRGPANEVPLARAALLIARAERPDLDVDEYERRLQSVASTLEDRVRGVSSIDARVDAAGTLLFDELGFRNDTEEYAHPRNLLLDQVIERRVGVPVTLALVYHEICQRAGLDARAVGLPGQVVARLEVPDGEPIFIDVAAGGRRLSAEDCREIVRRIYGRRTAFRDSFLEVITPRQVLQRLLHNLKARALQQGEEERAARTIELLLALFPWDLDELRDRGMLHERVGDYPGALEDLELYVRYRSAARDADTVAETVRSLRRHVGPSPS